MTTVNQEKADGGGRVLHIPAGTLIFEEGSPAQNMYLIREGVVEIFLPEIEGRKVLANLKAGEFFGEMALIDRRPRMASARAKTDVVLASVSLKDFEARLERSDPFIRAILRVLNRSYRELAKERHNR